MCWAQTAGEEQLGMDIPTVIQGCTVAVLLEAVRIQWDDNKRYPAHIKMVYEQYVQVYTSMYFDIDSI